jgi:tetratricopeptide (TPR) repeat protein
MLQDEEITEPLPAGVTFEERNALITAALESSDWEKSLRMLRMGESPFAPPALAGLRGAAYGGLGHTETALLFRKHASKLDPANEEYRAFLLLNLTSRDDLSEAISEAETILADSGPSANLRLQAGTVLFLCARDRTPAERPPILELAVEVLRTALVDVTAAGRRDVFTASGWVTLGSCYAVLQRTEDARSAFDAALEVIPDYAEALVERAFLRKENDPAGALADFQAAIQAGSRIPAPYLHVAYDALQRNDFDGCWSLCQRILGMEPSNQDRATVYHWLAICEYFQGRSLQAARDYLQMALRLNPSSDNIRADLEWITSSVGSGSPASLANFHPGPVVVNHEPRTETRDLPRADRTTRKPYDRRTDRTTLSSFQRIQIWQPAGIDSFLAVRYVIA